MKHLKIRDKNTAGRALYFISNYCFKLSRPRRRDN